ncbi:MAG: AAA family ATPase, partial [Myxococcota bacterium]
WRYDYGDWDEMVPKRPRRGESLFYPGDVKASIVEALQRFYDSREACQERCEPWRVAFMLEGPPGTGKTSLIHYAAGELRLGLALVSTRFLQHIRDSDLVKALGELPPGFLVVVEDIDRLFQAHEDEDKEPEVRNAKVDLSELLNLLDGFHTPEGVVFMMTANSPELLPDALTRRMIRIHVDRPTHKELLGFVETRRPGLGPAFVDALGDQLITIARVEQMLRMHANDETLLDAAHNISPTE